MPCLNRHRAWADDCFVVTTSLHIDCPTGLAGDMLLAALFDLEVPRRVIEEPLDLLGLAGLYRLEVQESHSGALRGKRLSVTGLQNSPPHRHWVDIRQQIESAALSVPLQRSVLAVFQALAEAEAAVHGIDPDGVHFHEVGAVDALVDVVGVCAAVEHLDPVTISCNPPPAGWGSVTTAHGVLPVPVPAVLELARRHSIPLHQAADLPRGELTTPTGLALMAVLAERFAPPQSMLPTAIGVGLGHRDLDRPNLLRICCLQADADFELAPRWQAVMVQEAWIDDASPEDLAILLKHLREAGALDVAVSALQMKKGRPAHSITVLVSPEKAEHLRQVWFSAGPSIGLRERQQGRWLLPRRAGTLTTPWGVLRAKQVLRPDGHCSLKPEADDLQRLSAETGCAIDALRAAASATTFVSDEPWGW